MTAIEEQLIKTWAFHNKTMLTLIEMLPVEAFAATLSARGGRDVAAQLSHVHGIRAAWLAGFCKKRSMVIDVFAKEHVLDRQALLSAFLQSSAVVEACIEFSIANEGKVPGYKAGIVPLIGYFIAHEAQHRGSILLILKQIGIKFPDELKWGIWE
jgi:uncharacterized damage-inducible protein DinB